MTTALPAADLESKYADDDEAEYVMTIESANGTKRRPERARSPAGAGAIIARAKSPKDRERPKRGKSRDKQVKLVVDPVKREKARALAEQMWEVQQRIPPTRRDRLTESLLERNNRAQQNRFRSEDEELAWQLDAMERRGAARASSDRNRRGPSIPFNAKLTLEPLPREVLMRLSEENVQVQPVRRK